MSDIIIARLSTGEELIAKVKEDNALEYHLADVLIIIPTKENSIGLVPFMPYSNCYSDGLTIKKSFVLFAVTPHEDLLTRYQEITGSIITSSSKLTT